MLQSLTADLPVIDPDTLAEFDGFIVCAGTRYGRQPASVSAFFDQTGGLWARGALKNKMAGFVTSTGSQHGGAESEQQRGSLCAELVLTLCRSDGAHHHPLPRAPRHHLRAARLHAARAVDARRDRRRLGLRRRHDHRRW